MDQRAIRQLNNPVFAEFCCVYNGGLVFENSDADINSALGIDPECSVNGKDLFDLVLETDVERLKSDIRSQFENGHEIDFILVTRNGSWVLVKGSCFVVSGTKYVKGILVPVTNIKNLFYSQAKIINEYEGRLTESNERASKDSLTCISNAQTTRSLCEEYIASTKNSFALMVIDVDCFKRINDNYGHMVGDKVLIAIADIIKNLFRNNDIVGRIGGDEFLVLMKGVDDRSIVDKRSSQIVSAFGNVRCCEVVGDVLSCSVGVAFVKNNTGKYDDIFKVADKAMYFAKNNGGNCFEVEEL